MNEQQLITDTIRRILQDQCAKVTVDAAEAGVWPAGLWQTLEDNGLTLAGISEASGGTGGELAASLLMIREAASVGAPLPLAETFIAARLCELVGAQMPVGPVTVSGSRFTLTQEGAGYRLQGHAENVAFANLCSTLIVVSSDAAGSYLCLVPLAEISQQVTQTMAGEPQSDFAINCLLPASAVFASAEDLSNQLWCLGAATRSVMMAGAMTSILEQSVQYAMERQQFGRPIAQFQAIQQQLAILAGEVAACQRAAESLNEALAPLNEFDIAIAKARISEAVGSATDIAHQVHGAMGYTMEHGLNLRTRRLWCWRDEYGNEDYWQQSIGRYVVAQGADNTWKTITDAG
ncbi:MAG: acyl-CoA dehydrogenase family protein [SAR86 cluster bacterium]|jgi:acyl-CoA dehydrogenase|uniref:Acyl-CoA/acyl-ACP dehydrogenase n=1 Tax=SAR86 cluster bacterium TaxID=2030880 RepID=A0A972VU68_9GAMM|nr:acyl-CoA/acyl-ACP dehydrogenase [SAR86 cluster bacterium]|tara:strand:+ start:6978 stop:8021 length:1044 start_codon:yes stop_codon:yes gene_type:complete